jgi:hypothetical protein
MMNAASIEVAPGRAASGLISGFFEFSPLRRTRAVLVRRIVIGFGARIINRRNYDMHQAPEAIVSEFETLILFG